MYEHRRGIILSDIMQLYIRKVRVATFKSTIRNLPLFGSVLLSFFVHQDRSYETQHKNIELILLLFFHASLQSYSLLYVFLHC